jgi:aryl-alcohol dehydrogenase-like predicted oxidoreductase
MGEGSFFSMLSAFSVAEDVQLAQIEEGGKMRYKLLGRSGLRVSEMALGTMTFGEDWGWGASKEEARGIFDLFVEAGGNFIDTACNYTEGTAEKFVGEFVQGNRDRFVIATKYSLRPNSADQHDPNAGGNHRKNLRRSVEASLKRLNTDYIDLLYLHMWDYTTPVEEVMRTLDDLVSAGKLLYAGFSDSPAYVISRANTLAELRGWVPLVAIQMPYSLASRDPERELFPMARQDDLAVTAWGLLGGGVLTGKYRDENATRRYEGASERSMRIADEVSRIARESGRTPAQVAINWVRAQKHKAQIIPILGARSQAQIQENLGALDFELDKVQLAGIDALSDFKAGFPADFLHDEEVLGLLHGKTYKLLDNHREH